MTSRASMLQSVKVRRGILHGILYVVLALAGFTFFVPFLWVISTSLKRSAEVFIVPIQWIPRDPQWVNYIQVFTKEPFALFMRNTGIIAVVGTLGVLASSLLVGFSLSHLRWPGRNVIFVAMLGTMMLPEAVLLVPTFIIFKEIHWLDTFLPLIVPSWFGWAFYIFLMRQFMMGIPYELDEAARLDGASSFRILTQVVVPMSKPAIATVAIFSFLAHYNDFLAPLIYLTSTEKWTITMGLYLFSGRYGNFWNLVMAASTIALIPVVVLFFAAQRYFVRGIQFTGIAGR